MQITVTVHDDHGNLLAAASAATEYMNIAVLEEAYGVPRDGALMRLSLRGNTAGGTDGNNSPINQAGESK
jgi:hypothetical protein